MLKDLVRSDILESLGAVLQENKWYMDTKTGKFSVAGRAFFDPNKLWVYTNPRTYDNSCSVYQMIVDSMNFIPSPCYKRCWKVVVKPFTLFELFKLWDFQRNYTKDCMGTDRFCKCGVEPREWVHNNYGGYFYCSSYAEGMKRWKEVREEMDKINPAIPVVLKRYCTEFELKLGPSNKYIYTPAMEAAEKVIFDAIDFDSLGDNACQPEYLVRHILRKWIEFAYARGDDTAMLFNDGEHLYSQTATYHPGGTIKYEETKEDK